MKKEREKGWVLRWSIEWVLYATLLVAGFVFGVLFISVRSTVAVHKQNCGRKEVIESFDLGGRKRVVVPPIQLPHLFVVVFLCDLFPPFTAARGRVTTCATRTLRTEFKTRLIQERCVYNRVECDGCNEA